MQRALRLALVSKDSNSSFPVVVDIPSKHSAAVHHHHYLEEYFTLK